MMTTEEYNDKPTGSDDGRDDLMLRLEFCLIHRATGALIPQHLMTEAFGILEDQQARIAALEAQVAAADRLATALETAKSLREAYNKMPPDNARIGSGPSPKSIARNKWLKALGVAQNKKLAAYRAAKGE